jgi:hypothetical protein
METERSLLHSQVPTTCPYPKPVRSSPYPHIPLPADSSYYHPPIYTWVFQVVSFLTQTPYTPLLSLIPATCPAHLIVLHLITRTILCEQYRSLSYSLCSFLHSPITSSLTGPNIPLNNILKHPKPTFLLQCEWPSFTPIQNNSKIIVMYTLTFKFLGTKLEDISTINLQCV